MTIKPFLSNQGVISYLIYNTSLQAILIDPSFDMAQEVVKFLKFQQIDLKYILETHTHADYFSSRRVFGSLYPDLKVAMSQNASSRDKQIELKDKDIIKLDRIHITAKNSPGHTADSMIYVLPGDDGIRIFTGDTLLIGGTGRTDFQAGNSQDLFDSLKYLATFPDQTIIHPAHNYQGQTASLLGVEKQINPRLKLVVQNQLTEFLNLLDNHHPNKPGLFEESLTWNGI